MPKTYTVNQTGAIACLLATNLWALAAHGTGWMIGQTHPIYSILIAIGWILLPFYIMLKRHAFIAGIFFTVLAMSYLPITPGLLGTMSWYTFTDPLLHSSFIVWYLVAISGVYFAYKSWRELQLR